MTIRFENDMLSIALPAGWVDQSESDVLAFINPSTSEELSISLGPITQCADSRRLAAILWRLIQAKASAFGQLSLGTFTVLDTVQPTASIPSVGTFSGLDSKNSVYARTAVTGCLSHFVSVTYYLHKCQAASPEIAARADVVIGMCRTKVAAA